MAKYQEPKENDTASKEPVKVGKISDRMGSYLKQAEARSNISTPVRAYPNNSPISLDLN